MAMRQRTDLLVVHVSATPPHMDIGVKEIDAMHRARGWSGIGYHFVIRRNGEIEIGRPLNEIGAHVAGYNSRSVGVCMVGGVDRSGRPEDNATPQQYASLENLLKQLSTTFPAARVCGHRDLSPDKNRNGIIEPQEHMKACPCFDAIPWAKQRGLKVANIRGRWDMSAPLPTPDKDEERLAYLQRLLARTGLSFGPVDGIIGPKTISALRQYQEFSGLRQTGEFDAQTVGMLRERFERQAVRS